MKRLGGLPALAICVLLSACAEGGGQARVPTEPQVAALASTYGQIQRSIFDRQCVACHGALGSAFRQSGLSLEPAVSYQNLLGTKPVNATAIADGLVRVMPGNPGVSLLFHKLNWNAEHHGGRNYGNAMPLGGEPLSIGQLEFVRKWIAAGAPRTGYVADSALLVDTRKQYVEEFKPLPRPAAGFQVRIDSFDIAPNFERELFQYRRVGNTEDIFVNRIETRMRLNSHHLLVMTFKDSTPLYVVPQHDVIRDIRGPSGEMLYQNMLVMGWHEFFAGAGTPYEDKVLPPGVALRLPANISLDLNSHFINTGLRHIPGEVYVNLHTIPRSEVQHVVKPFTFAHDSFELPPGRRTTVTRTFLFERAVTILMLTSHNHELGERFEIRIAGGARDGEVVYRSSDWKHPLILWLSQPLVLHAGEGLTSVVTYDNTTTRAVRHGFLSTDEMNIMRGYAY